MNNLSKYSKFLHGISFLCLCLPFFYTGCKEAATEQPVVDVKKEISVDSTNANLHTVDSISTNNTTQQAEKIVTPKSEIKQNKKDETRSETLSKKYVFLQPILVSDEYTFSGLAIVIDLVENVPFFGIFLYVLLSVLSLIIKYLKTSGLKTIVLLDVLALFFLIISKPIALFYDKLPGVWITIIVFAMVTILDSYLLTKCLQNKNKPEQNS